ncbi:HD-GYP domain-containing protein [Pseudorhodoferax sp. Leaf274]|uniref:HD-GYP domain-containing protein n=1 Tax=Pseudorhodoferax sp. Leaf274 TaxID=1736318 RepID=UPI0007037429|nr:two-component system response regulator [Pseudorhodoferax sp. Leaf274]KQP38890.1 two-component system response regulator [Pseudorhodoferax sp. Leaf274]
MGTDVATAKPTIMVVDDTPDNLELISGILRHQYKIRVATTGLRALAIARSASPPDIILLDISMPEMDGYQVCAALKDSAGTAAIPVIFMTARNDVDDETKGFECGAVDYITKPFVAPLVLARVKAQIGLKRMADFLRDQNGFLEREVARRTQEVCAIQDVTILAMASLSETRDNETGNHIRRTQHYVHALAKRLQQDPRYAPDLSDAMIMMLYKSAPLHDIGKVGIPDSILLKADRLTPQEFEIMKTHTTLGRDSIQQAEDELGIEVDFLRLAKEIACSHQEKWDGSGYPYGLKGLEIPLSARLMAIADVYDALISVRVYKPAMTHPEAVATMVKGKGSHFDPDLLEAFLTIQDEFQDIALRFRDA